MFDRQGAGLLDARRHTDTDYLVGCRQKRNTVEYDHAGDTLRRDAGEPIAGPAESAGHEPDPSSGAGACGGGGNDNSM